jgi:hypothetical protein
MSTKPRNRPHQAISGDTLPCQQHAQPCSQPCKSALPLLSSLQQHNTSLHHSCPNCKLTLAPASIHSHITAD